VWGPKGTRVVAAEAQWRQPLKWNRAAACDCHCRADLGEKHLASCPQANRPRVFCASLADVFEEWAGLMSASDGSALYVCAECGAWQTMAEMCHGPNAHLPLTMDDARRRLFRLIADTPHLNWLLLTKRPAFAREWLGDFYAGWNASTEADNRSGPKASRHPQNGPFPNVWAGVSVEDQQRADERIPILLDTPAAVRWISAEPLLGPVDLSRLWLPDRSGWWNALDGRLTAKAKTDDGQEFWCETEQPLRPRLNWCVVGGESGPGARPMALDWARSLVKQCRAAKVACFVKQLGACPTYTTYEGKPLVPVERPWTYRCDNGPVGPPKNITRAGFRDRKGADMGEWPADLQVREWPTQPSLTQETP
jgi:protein gp37